MNSASIPKTVRFAPGTKTSSKGNPGQLNPQGQQQKPSENQRATSGKRPSIKEYWKRAISYRSKDAPKQALARMLTEVREQKDLYADKAIHSAVDSLQAMLSDKGKLKGLDTKLATLKTLIDNRNTALQWDMDAMNATLQNLASGALASRDRLNGDTSALWTAAHVERGLSNGLTTSEEYIRDKSDAQVDQLQGAYASHLAFSKLNPIHLSTDNRWGKAKLVSAQRFFSAMATVPRPLAFTALTRHVKPSAPASASAADASIQRGEETLHGLLAGQEAWTERLSSQALDIAQRSDAIASFPPVLSPEGQAAKDAAIEKLTELQRQYVADHEDYVAAAHELGTYFTARHSLPQKLTALERRQLQGYGRSLLAQVALLNSPNTREGILYFLSKQKTSATRQDLSLEPPSSQEGPLSLDELAASKPLDFTAIQDDFLQFRARNEVAAKRAEMSSQLDEVNAFIATMSPPTDFDPKAAAEDIQYLIDIVEDRRDLDGNLLTTVETLPPPSQMRILDRSEVQGTPKAAGRWLEADLDLGSVKFTRPEMPPAEVTKRREEINLLLDTLDNAPTAQPPAEALVEPTAEPLAEPAAEPLAGPSVEPLAQPLAEPPAEPVYVDLFDADLQRANQELAQRGPVRRFFDRLFNKKVAVG